MGDLPLAVFGLSGIAAGFFAGLFGIGGGLILVPVLVYAFTTTGGDTQHAVAMALGWICSGDCVHVAPTFKDWFDSDSWCSCR